MALLLHHAFVNLGLHRVWTEAFAFNAAWKRLLEGWGFTREGCLRDYLFRDGQYWDKETYGLLDTEYARLPKGGAPRMHALSRHHRGVSFVHGVLPAVWPTSDAA
jgi:hypothetical protein